MTDVVRIAGAGLSGLSAALLLARAGRSVEVYDRRPGPGGRFAGGWQVIENGSREQDALDEISALGIPVSFKAVPIRQALFLDGLGRRHAIASERPFSYFIRRGGTDSVDAALRREAEAAGVSLRFGVPAPVDCELMATGPTQADGSAREVVFTSDLPDTVAVLFDPAVTPTGYAYLFCLSGHATFGVAEVRRQELLRDAHRVAWERFRRELGDFAVRDAREGGQFMSFSLPRGLRDGRGRWYAGEAAGVQDFLFGLGNRLAFRSAAVATAGLLGAWDERAFRSGVLRPMQASIGLRLFYEGLGRRGLALFCSVAARRDFRRLLIGLQRPHAGARLLGRVAMGRWSAPRCRHGELCGWCRERAA